MSNRRRPEAVNDLRRELRRFARAAPQLDQAGLMEASREMAAIPDEEWAVIGPQLAARGAAAEVAVWDLDRLLARRVDWSKG